MNVYHTGNYVKSHYNFRISGLTKKPCFSPITSVLFNIHFRGSPSFPSYFLKTKLLEKGVVSDGSPSVQIDCEYKPNWKNTIKGAENGQNPALDFYEKKLPILLGEFRFLYPLVRPEALITDFIPNEEAKRFSKERVDFFLPTANLVIEIDGSQHKKEVNVQKDNARNELLKKNHIHTFRLSTQQLKDRKEVDKFGLDLINYLTRNKLLLNFKSLLSVDVSESNHIFTSIYRIQAVLIEMLGRNLLSLDNSIWKLSITSNIDSSFYELIKEDLFNWVKLIDKEQTIPKVKFTDKNPDFSIDVSVGKRWDDSVPDKDVIYCHTDHFDYFPGKSQEDTTSKDYFSSSYSYTSRKIKLERINLKGLLKETFHHDTFKKGQIDIIDNVLQSNDTIGLLPTGGGKSLCYQLPGILFSKIILVICPIKSLMRDQVEELAQIGFNRSACINSSTSVSDKNKILRKVEAGQIKFLFVSPERLQISSFRETIGSVYSKNLLSLVVIDEVHCMSEWGHDFRTSYLTLPHTLDIVATNTPKLCLTATASLKVLDDIKRELKIESENVKTLKVYKRENLFFSVIECQPFQKVHDILKKEVRQGGIGEGGAGIVFTSFVNGVSGAYPLYQSISKYIPDTGLFTGSKPKNHVSENFENEKTITQIRFKKNKFPLLVATKAFGMGVNKTNVYTTIHVGLPQSVESLYQEAGRAGRDGKKSKCYVLINNSSTTDMDKFFNTTNYKEFIDLNFRNSGDLSIHHFFICCNIKDNYKVPSVVESILKQLNEKQVERSEGGKEAPQSRAVVNAKSLQTLPRITELALYRLYQMGLIQDWTVEDFFKGIYSVDYKIQYIGYHNDVVKRLTGGAGLQEAVLNNTETMNDWFKAMTKLATIVIEHHLSTRVHSRIESLKTLLLACSDYQKNEPEKFRENIEKYFEIDSINDSLSDIVESSGSVTSIVSYFSGTGDLEPLLRQPLEKVQARLFPLRRQIESYPEDIGLALINEILMLHLKERADLRKLISILKKYNSVLGREGFYAFLNQLSGLFKIEKWEALESAICQTIDDIEELNKFAVGVNSSLATLKIIANIEPKIQKMSEKLYESI